MGQRSKTASRKSSGVKSNESNLISVIGTLNHQLIACKEELNSVKNLREAEEQKQMQLKASYVELEAKYLQLKQQHQALRAEDEQNYQQLKTLYIELKDKHLELEQNHQDGCKRLEDELSFHVEKRNECLELMNHLKEERQELQKKKRKLDTLSKAIVKVNADSEPLLTRVGQAVESAVSLVMAGSWSCTKAAVLCKVICSGWVFSSHMVKELAGFVKQQM